MASNSYELNQIAALLNTVIGQATGMSGLTTISIKDMSTVAQTGSGLVPAEGDNLVGSALVGYALAG